MLSAPENADWSTLNHVPGKATRLVEGCIVVEQNYPKEGGFGKMLAGATEEFKAIEAPKALAENGSILRGKLKQLGICPVYTDWKCDRKYAGKSMYISDDGLTIGCILKSDCVPIIGDTPISYGLLAFEVTGETFTEGDAFGVIELDKFMAAHYKEKNYVPFEAVMIGYSFKKGPKNMAGRRRDNLSMGTAYKVYLELVSYEARVVGPGIDVRAELAPGKEYVPCFICSDIKSKIIVTPLKQYVEEKAAPEPVEEEIQIDPRALGGLFDD